MLAPKSTDMRSHEDAGERAGTKIDRTLDTHEPLALQNARGQIQETQKQL